MFNYRGDIMYSMKLAKAYEPAQYEDNIYALWEKSGVFTPNGKGKAFSIVMPPPNANANLHIGYELTAVLEDIAARYHRLKGESVLLLPGADHAGLKHNRYTKNSLLKKGRVVLTLLVNNYTNASGIS
jgi:valyl-tRNA synthetase